MPAEIEPPELARLVDFAERPRTAGWSLRSALVRYAQPQPERASDILDLTRRLDGALAHHRADLERRGGEIWSTLEDGAAGDVVFGLLRVAQALDGLGDVLATWAVDRAGVRPDTEVDEVVEDVAPQLDALGVPHEEGPPPRRGRG